MSGPVLTLFIHIVADHFENMSQVFDCRSWPDPVSPTATCGPGHRHHRTRHGVTPKQPARSYSAVVGCTLLRRPRIHLAPALIRRRTHGNPQDRHASRGEESAHQI